MPSMIDIVLILFLIFIIGGAVFYVVKAKKNGAKCIGCPASGTCSSKKCGQSECHCGSTEEAHTGCCCNHSDTN